MEKKTIFEKTRVTTKEIIKYLNWAYDESVYNGWRLVLTKDQKALLQKFADKIPDDLIGIYDELVDPDGYDFSSVLEEEYANTLPIPWDDKSREWLEDPQ